MNYSQLYKVYIEIASDLSDTEAAVKINQGKVNPDAAKITYGDLVLKLGSDQVVTMRLAISTLITQVQDASLKSAIEMFHDSMNNNGVRIGNTNVRNGLLSVKANLPQDAQTLLDLILSFGVVKYFQETITETDIVKAKLLNTSDINYTQAVADEYRISEENVNILSTSYTSQRNLITSWDGSGDTPTVWSNE